MAEAAPELDPAAEAEFDAALRVYQLFSGQALTALVDVVGWAERAGGQAGVRLYAAFERQLADRRPIGARLDALFTASAAPTSERTET